MLSMTKASPKPGRISLPMSNPHPQVFNEQIPFSGPLKETLVAIELAMVSIATSTRSLEEPNYLGNMMQIWSLLTSWLCDRLKEGKQKTLLLLACGFRETILMLAHFKAARETQEQDVTPIGAPCGHSDAEKGWDPITSWPNRKARLAPVPAGPSGMKCAVYGSGSSRKLKGRAT